MFLAMTPQNAVRCVTRYAPVVKRGSDPFSDCKLRTLRVLCIREKGASWVRENHEKGVSWLREKHKKVAL